MQKIAELCVRRPVFATMLVAALTVIGAVSFFGLGVDRYPRIETPVVSVSTANRGATPESIETEVTDRIEAAVNTVAGIDELRSNSAEGNSNVNITFDLSKNPDVAAQEVRAKVDPVIRNLPETADPPVVQKQDPDSTPIMMFSVSAPLLSVELTTFIEQNIQKRLESVNGVGEVVLYGSRRRQLQIKVDPDRLNAYGLSTTDVAAALRAQNLELPGGRLDQGARDLSVRTVGRLGRPEEFLDLVVATRGTIPIRIREVGTVADTGADPTSVAMLNGKSAVSVAIRKQSGVNTVALADALRARMAEIQQTLPPNFDVRLIRDDSEFIRASMRAITEHLILGGFLAALIVLIFLRNFRSTVITAIAIPTSIIGAFSLMAALDFTLNQMTMLALTLMVGIVIDDAIVVLENIYRFIEEKGMPPFLAAIDATREIGLAVTATTLALLAVFVPVGFLGGIVGRFMSSFGLTAAAAIAISLIVSFTLTPMLAARWIRRKHVPAAPGAAPPAHGQEVSRRGFYRHIDRAYTKMLTWSMAHRVAIVVVCGAVIASVIPLFRASGVNFTPDEDESRFQITARLPVGSSIAATQTLLERIARDMREELPGVTDTLAIVGFGRGGGQANAGQVFVRLQPIADREFSQQELVARARRMIQPYRQAATISIQGSGGLTAISGRGAAIQYALVGPNLDRLDEYTQAAVETLQKAPELVDADRGYLPGRPELRITVDRHRAADLGVRVDEISQTVNALLAGQEVTTFNAASDQYDVVLKAQDSFRRTPESVASATVRTAGGQLVPLRTLVTFHEGAGPASIERLNRQRQITISANPAPGVSQAEGQAVVQKTFEALDMEPGYSLVPSGQSRELGRAAYYFAVAFALSFIFMYMVLAAQFESFIHPITILLTLPIAVPCGLLASLLFGQQLNIYSALGVLLLFGIVKKNAILQIDHTLALRARGVPRYDAIIQANRDRLRPILMTTLALIAGMLPLCLGSGPGAETNRSIGLLVVGGQTLCLLLTLLAVPVFYSLFDDIATSTAWRRLIARLGRRPRLASASIVLIATLVGAPLAGAQGQAAMPLPGQAAPRIGVDAAPPLPVTLAELIRLALDQNNDIAIARADTHIAAEEVRAATGAFDVKLFPGLLLQRAVNASASALGGATQGRVEQTLTSATAQLAGRLQHAGSRFWVDFASSRLATSNQFSRLNPQFPASFGVTFLQPLLRGRQIDADRRVLAVTRHAATLGDAELSRSIMDQLMAVELAYWELVFTIRNLDVQLQALSQAETQVASNERQSREGTLAPIDVIEAQTQVATFRQGVASARQALTEAENRLKPIVLTSRTAPEWGRALVPGDPDDRPLPAWTLDDAVQLALRQRPELIALDTARADNAVDREFYQDQAKPQIDLTGTVSFSGLAGGALAETGETVPPFLVGNYGTSLSNLFARRFPTASLQIQLELPLANTTARANVARTELEAAQIARRRQQLDQQIEAQVRNAMQAVHTARDRREAAAVASRSALELYESERRRFESGLSTVFLVLERQADLVTAQARELRARADVNQAITLLERAVGHTLDRHGVSVKQP